MRRVRFTTLAVLMLLCLSAGLFLPTVQAADVLCHAEAMPMEESADISAEIVVEDFTGDGGGDWMTSSGTSDVHFGEVEGVLSMNARIKKNDAHRYGVVCLFDNGGVNLMMQTTLRYAIYLQDSGTDTLYPITLRMHCGVSSMTAQTTVPAGEWYLVSVDVSGWALRTNIHMAEFLVEDSGDSIEGFSIGSITAGGTADMEIAETFLTFGFHAEGGSAEYVDGEYYLEPGRDGAITLVADAVRRDYTAQPGVSAVRVVLDNAMEGGIISLAVAEGAADTTSFTISSTCSVYFGENVYLLPYDSSLELRAYRLSFHSLYPDATDRVTLRSVSVCHLPDEGGTLGLGRVRSCTLSEDSRTLTMQGTLPASLAAEHTGGTLALMEFPLWQTEVTVWNAPLAEKKMSTQFTFTLDMSGREHLASLSRYQVVIVAEDGTILPVTDALYPERGQERPESTLSAVGLHGADSADVFQSNASSVILDVYVDRLLGGREGLSAGRLVVRGGQYYHLDNAYIRELDEEIRFAEAADVQVYLRLLCASDLSDIGYTFSYPDAQYYAFDVHSESGASVLAAVTDFLAARYPAICGLIAGARMDAAVYNGADQTDASAYAALCADTLRLIYASAVVHIPTITVVAPLGHYTMEVRQFSETRSQASQPFSDPVLLASMISKRLERGGNIPWGLLYISDSSSEGLGHTQNILSGMKAMGCSAPTESLLMWQPPAEYDADLVLLEYNDRCYAACHAGMRVMFLSLSPYSTSVRQSIATGMKYVLDETEYRRPLSEFEAQVLSEKPTVYAGRYVLHDFTTSYSTQGWIAGSGCERLLTESGDDTGGRSLEAVFTAAGGDLFTPVSGNILSVSGVTDDFTYAPAMLYSLELTTQLDSAREADLTFIFGSGDERAEYTVTVPTGVPVEVLCDLSRFEGADTVDFSAISVQCESTVYLNIRRIVCASEKNDSATLAQMFRYRSVTAGAETEMGDGEFTAMQKMLIGTMLLGSIMVIALSTRRRGKNA